MSGSCLKGGEAARGSITLSLQALTLSGSCRYFFLVALHFLGSPDNLEKGKMLTVPDPMVGKDLELVLPDQG